MQNFHLTDDFNVLILYMPTRWDVYSYNIVEKLNQDYPAKCKGFSQDDLNSGFSKWLETQANERDFLFLDPSDNLLEISTEQKKILYYPFDFHTNSLGNWYLAEIIARFVTDLNIQ